MFKFRYLNLNTQELNTFRLHTTYRILEGVVLGVLALNEYVFIRSMLGTNYQLAFLFQFSVIIYIFLLFFNEIRKRIRNKKSMLRITALVTRLPLFLLLLFPRSTEQMETVAIYHYIFLGIFLVYYFGNIVIYPAINVLLKTNYRHQNFGKLYSYSTSVNKLVTLVATFVYGMMLDQDQYIYVYVFPVIALLDIAGIFFLSKIDYSQVLQSVQHGSVGKAVTASLKGMRDILRKNKPYLHFELGFMFYGFSFMVSHTIINIYFDSLGLNYSSVAFYKNAYNILAITILPFFGKLLGNIDPRKFATITFSSLLLFITFVMLTEFIPYHITLWDIDLYLTLVLAYLSYGVFAATMVLLWNIGSAYFCQPEEADDYQSIHLSLTGIRSLFAPILGVLIYESAGFTVTFSIGIIMILVGIVLMKWSYEKDRAALKD